jgi:hypothetical protein
METLDDLSAKELISDDELQRMAIPIVGRRARDFLSPFAPSGTFEKLSIADLEVFDAEDRFWSQYQIDKDARLLGRQWAAFLRESIFPTLAAALDGRDDGHCGRFVDELSSGVAARIAAAPAQVQIPLALVVIEKKQRTHH